MVKKQETVNLEQSPKELQSQKTISQEDLQEFRQINENISNYTSELGRIVLRESELEKRKGDLKKEIEDQRQVFNLLLSRVEKKYGKGTIDLNTGEFVSVG